MLDHNAINQAAHNANRDRAVSAACAQASYVGFGAGCLTSIAVSAILATTICGGLTAGAIGAVVGFATMYIVGIRYAREQVAKIDAQE